MARITDNRSVAAHFWSHGWDQVELGFRHRASPLTPQPQTSARRLAGELYNLRGPRRRTKVVQVGRSGASHRVWDKKKQLPSKETVLVSALCLLCWFMFVLMLSLCHLTELQVCPGKGGHTCEDYSPVFLWIPHSMALPQGNTLH